MNSTEYQAFLQECFRENLAHMRHVENERITFYALYLVFAGTLLTLFFSCDFTEWGKFGFSLLWLCLSLICFWLLKRWDEVYSGHRLIAMRQLEMLMQDTPVFPCDKVKDPLAQAGYWEGNPRHENYFYYLAHEKGRRILENWQESKEKQPGPGGWLRDWRHRYRIQFYWRTVHLFYLFNILITGAALTLTVVYFCRAAAISAAL